MRLKVILPVRVLVDRQVVKVTGEAQNGSFCLLPRHVDFAAALVPGLLAYVPEGEEAEEQFLAVDEGVLIKCGDEVLVSTRNAVGGAALGELERGVRQRFEELDEYEKQARTALAQLESQFVLRFVELGE